MQHLSIPRALLLLGLGQTAIAAYCGTVSGPSSNTCNAIGFKLGDICEGIKGIPDECVDNGSGPYVFCRYVSQKYDYLSENLYNVHIFKNEVTEGRCG
jgi:hypothetical protein